MRNRNSQIRVSKTPCLKLKCEVSWTQKGSLIAIMLSAHRRGSRKERNGFVKAKAKQVIVYKYLQDFFALKLLNPSVTIVYAQSTFFPDVVNQQKSISEINRYYRY